ncbi:MAG: hypothetical protein M5U10_06480 [Candidatus Methanoperedens sp.]|nr:hypothetical protein [Candidatus Methanoperedens sp.]
MTSHITYVACYQVVSGGALARREEDASSFPRGGVPTRALFTPFLVRISTTVTEAQSEG